MGCFVPLLPVLIVGLLFNGFHHAAGQLEASCKLELIGLPPSDQQQNRFGVHSAKLDCTSSSGEPITIRINDTYIADLADDFTGVTVERGPCALTATNAFDFLELMEPSPAPPALLAPDATAGNRRASIRPAAKVSAAPAYEIIVYPLICFHGHYKVTFEKPVIRDISLDYMKAAGEGWSTAVLAFQKNVEARLLQADITGNRAGSALVAVDNTVLKVHDRSLIEGSFSIVGGAAGAWGEAVLDIRDSVIRGNTARKGGGVYVCGFAQLNVVDSLFKHNHAIRYGGALYLYDSISAVVSSTRFLGNSAVEYGGSIEVGNFVTLEVKDGTVMEGGSASWGGCIDALEMSKTTFAMGTACRNNTGTWVGGGASISGSAEFHITGSEWTGNQARAGGAIYIEGQAILTIDKSRIEDNRAESDGGGVWLKDAAEVTISGGSSVSYNYAALQGGGLSLWATSQVEVSQGSKISHNSAVRRGGGVFALGGFSTRKKDRDGSLVILRDGSTISHNTAALGGGVRLNDACILSLHYGSSVVNNAAQIDGGGVYAADRSLLRITEGSTVADNTATRFGGGVVLLSNASKLADLEAGVRGNKARYSANVAVLTTNLSLVGESKALDKPIETDDKGVAVIELDATGHYGLPTPGMLVQADLLKEGEEDSVVLGVKRTDKTGRVVMALSFASYPPGDYKVSLFLVANVELMILGVDVPDVNVTVRVRPSPSQAAANACGGSGAGGGPSDAGVLAAAGSGAMRGGGGAAGAASGFAGMGFAAFGLLLLVLATACVVGFVLGSGMVRGRQWLQLYMVDRVDAASARYQHLAAAGV